MPGLTSVGRVQRGLQRLLQRIHDAVQPIDGATQGCRRRQRRSQMTPGVVQHRVVQPDAMARKLFRQTALAREQQRTGLLVGVFGQMAALAVAEGVGQIRGDKVVLSPDREFTQTALASAARHSHTIDRSSGLARGGALGRCLRRSFGNGLGGSLRSRLGRELLHALVQCVDADNQRVHVLG